MRKKDDEIDISQWEASPWEPASEAGTSRTLKTLWFPTSTIPTLKSGQIVYGCASLLGEQWDFSLAVFCNWHHGEGSVF